MKNNQVLCWLCSSCSKIFLHVQPPSTKTMASALPLVVPTTHLFANSRTCCSCVASLLLNNIFLLEREYHATLPDFLFVIYMKPNFQKQLMFYLHFSYCSSLLFWHYSQPWHFIKWKGIFRRRTFDRTGW